MGMVMQSIGRNPEYGAEARKELAEKLITADVCEQRIESVTFRQKAQLKKHKMLEHGIGWFYC